MNAKEATEPPSALRVACITLDVLYKIAAILGVLLTIGSTVANLWAGR